MGNLLYVVAIVLILVWALGLIAYDAGGLIHLLLVVAVIVLLVRIILGRRIL